MIKLNNKNITYVALADSSNSLKAPKEIWYADSNNSVKLVYRRKDALIEGEDYEKYHWLKGDDSAYIQGIAFDLWNNHFNARIGKNERLRYFNYYVQSTAANFKIEVDNNVNIPYLLAIFRNAENGVHIDELRPYSAMPDVVDYDFYIDNSTFYCNRDGVIHTNSGTNIAIESNWTSIQPMIKSAKISYIREVLPNDTYRSNLIPCKLLKPVPKWLDANGIRRQVGECGMIDLVSGKFYGNVNSNGTFTVENYYERKEWLQGRNGAYIDTNYYPIVGTDVFSVHFRYDGTLRNPEGLEQDVFGVDSSNNVIRAYINGSNYLTCNYLKSNNVFLSTGVHSNEWVVNNLMLNGDKFQYSANGIIYSFSNNEMQQQTLSLSIPVFKAKLSNNLNCYFHGDIASFKITDTSSNTKMNLIPCTLTMDLPASMDANNIARTKGTSGMWDLVSDKFYGNVANSGTFKAVNLAEGVDYEVHQWLVGDGSAYIFIGEYSESVKFKVKLTSPSVDFGFVYGYNGALRTYKNSNTFTANIPDNIISRVSLPNIKEILIDFSEHLVYADDVQIAYTNKGSEGNDESSFKKAYFWGYEILSSFRSDCSIETIYADNQVFIPVKLLKSIPSTYDANGIARQAGECGMYDTVNDVFYGNVASSGSFTVKDDN